MQLSPGIPDLRMRLLQFFAAAAMLAAQSQTQPQAQPKAQTKTGLELGTVVPGFALQDQSGQTRTIESLMGPKGLMLVFYRSADW
jgi:hypothetical protein